MKQLFNSSSRLRRFLCGGAAASVAASSALAFASPPTAEAALTDSPKQIIDEVWQIVNNEFVDNDFNQVDWQITRQELLAQNYSSQAEAYSAIRKALRGLGDRYTRFLTPKEFEQLTNQTSGELSGVGLRLEINQQTQVLTVVEPLDNSPASEAQIQPGDEILSIDDKPTTLMTLEQASDLMRGEIDTQVSLEIRRQGTETFKVTLNRATIELPAVDYQLRQEEQIRVGYISLKEFNSHAAEDMKQAIEELSNQQVKGFVLDLRGNPGGLLFASVDIARMWLHSGAIVSTVDRKGGNSQYSANHTAITDLPLVVLVDNNSASASEILAGALKDNGRATLVGTKTYGKGTVQSVHSLSDGSGLAVTISRYYPPSGLDINQKGITPDIALDLSGEEKLILQANPMLIGTQDDPQYARAVNVLKTTSLGHTPQLPTPVGIR